MTLIRTLFLTTFLFTTGFTLAHANEPTTVRFTQRELAAGFVFLRPELNSFELDGRKGKFTPSPALEYLGIAPEEFSLDMSTLGNIADIRFNHLQSKKIDVSFVANALQLTVSVNDQAAAVQSRLGAISIQNVSLTMQVNFIMRSNGRQELHVASSAFSGNLSGTGVLRSSLVLNAVKKLMLKTITNKVKSMLASSTTQDSIATGLMQWAKFYDGKAPESVIPGSIRFQTDGFSYDVD